MQVSFIHSLIFPKRVLSSMLFAPFSNFPSYTSIRIPSLPSFTISGFSCLSHLTPTLSYTCPGTTVNIPVRTDYCVITKLKLDKSRKKILDRKSAGRSKALGEKGKITAQEVTANAQVD